MIENSTMKENKMHEYTKYFKDNQGFERLILKAYKKYQSLSKFSGTIKISNLTKEESKTLSRFFGTIYEEGTNITIPLKKFITIMENSKYEDFDFGTLIEEYFDTTLTTTKESNAKTKEEETAFYATLYKPNSKGSEWLKHVTKNKVVPYKLIHQRYHQNKNLLNKDLQNIINLIDNLPASKTLLPIYSSTITKDPHYLDLDTKNSTIFYYALSYLNNTSYPTTRTEKIKLLSNSNIEIDTISNFVITYNLYSNKDYINSFSQNKETLILNIQNIITTSFFDTPSKKVFIFENPSILTEIISRDIDASVIISAGFPNTSVYLLIDALISTSNHIYYNGDFDPEGLIIANKLKEKYQDNLTLFCYTKLDYQECISKKKISQPRLNKLSKITSPDLLGIKELLLQTKYSAYQENNKERIITYIIESLKP